MQPSRYSLAAGNDPYAIALILTLVLPSETVNALGMHRVGSPYLVSLVFILLTIVGAVLALLVPDVQGSSISGSLLVYEPVGS